MFFVQAFDDLLLMKAGGMITYHGHLGKRSHALVTYFEVRHSPCSHGPHRHNPQCHDRVLGKHPGVHQPRVSTPRRSTERCFQPVCEGCCYAHVVADPHVLVQNIPGVPKLEEGLNPATWMLQISTPGMEANLNTDFNEQYRNSRLYQCVHCPTSCPSAC